MFTRKKLHTVDWYEISPCFMVQLIKKNKQMCLLPKEWLLDRRVQFNHKIPGWSERLNKTSLWIHLIYYLSLKWSVICVIKKRTNSSSVVLMDNQNRDKSIQLLEDSEFWNSGLTIGLVSRSYLIVFQFEVRCIKCCQINISILLEVKTANALWAKHSLYKSPANSWFTQ